MYIFLYKATLIGKSGLQRWFYIILVTSIYTYINMYIYIYMYIDMNINMSCTYNQCIPIQAAPIGKAVHKGTVICTYIYIFIYIDIYIYTCIYIL
jgi:hypothetical protein